MFQLIYVHKLTRKFEFNFSYPKSEINSPWRLIIVLKFCLKLLIIFLTHSPKMLSDQYVLSADNAKLSEAISEVISIFS